MDRVIRTEVVLEEVLLITTTTIITATGRRTAGRTETVTPTHGEAGAEVEAQAHEMVITERTVASPGTGILVAVVTLAASPNAVVRQQVEEEEEVQEVEVEEGEEAIIVLWTTCRPVVQGEDRAMILLSPHWGMLVLAWAEEVD